jgi:hypothetical protein
MAAIAAKFEMRRRQNRAYQRDRPVTGETPFGTADRAQHAVRGLEELAAEIVDRGRQRLQPQIDPDPGASGREGLDCRDLFLGVDVDQNAVRDRGADLGGSLVATVHDHAPGIGAADQAGVQFAKPETIAARAFLAEHRPPSTDKRSDGVRIPCRSVPPFMRG